MSDHLLQPPYQTRVLLALSNDDVAEAAIQVTDALAEHRAAVPIALHVFDPSGYAPPPFVPTMMSFAEALIGPDTSAERREQIIKRASAACGHPVTWPVLSRLGNPTTCIAHEAAEHESELIVMGLHHHGRADHLLGAETTIRVMTRAGRPVFAVTKNLTGLPHRVLAAVDFGRASVHMARLVARLIEPPGELILAYVQTPVPPAVPEEDEGRVAIHQHGIEASFGKLIHDVAPIAGVSVKKIVLTGSPGQAILEYAEHVKPDVIGVASQRHPLSTRLLLGSVSRHIVRDGRWSVFVTPVA